MRPGKIALPVQHGAGGIQAHSQQRPHRLGCRAWVGGRGGSREAVQIGDGKDERVWRGLQRHPLLQRPQIVAHVQPPARLHRAVHELHVSPPEMRKNRA